MTDRERADRIARTRLPSLELCRVFHGAACPLGCSIHPMRFDDLNELLGKIRDQAQAHGRR